MHPLEALQLAAFLLLWESLAFTVSKHIAIQACIFRACIFRACIWSLCFRVCVFEPVCSSLDLVACISGTRKRETVS